MRVRMIFREPIWIPPDDHELMSSEERAKNSRRITGITGRRSENLQLKLREYD